MKKWGMSIFLFLFLVGCRQTPFDGHTVIEWVDFIKWEGTEYDGIHSGVLANKRFIGEKIGTVKYKVADNVTNPNYKIRDGDAAFHEKGTEIYEIKDHPNLIAVKSDQSINGYQVYFSRDDIEYKWHFKNMPLDKVRRIEIFISEGNHLISEWTEEQEIQDFLQLLATSETNNAFEPDTDNGDPVNYEMIFYTEEPIAYKYNMQFDGSTYFWFPWETSILSDKISLFIDGN